MKAKAKPSRLLKSNVDRVLKIEEHAARQRSRAEHASELIGAFVGTFAFVAVHVVLITIWVGINTGWLDWTRPFDRYPFNLLSTVASVEAVVLSAFVLMRQNRMAQLADRRDHLDLQVNLLTEQEASMAIQMLDRISRKLGVDSPEHEEALQLSRTSTLDHLVDELHKQLPDTEGQLPPPQR